MSAAVWEERDFRYPLWCCCCCLNGASSRKKNFSMNLLLNWWKYLVDPARQSSLYCAHQFVCFYSQVELKVFHSTSISNVIVGRLDRFRSNQSMAHHLQMIPSLYVIYFWNKIKILKAPNCVFCRLKFKFDLKFIESKFLYLRNNKNQFRQIVNQHWEEFEFIAQKCQQDKVVWLIKSLWISLLPSNSRNKH